MEILTIKYSRKINLGNYESEDVSFEASLEEGDDPMQCLADLKQAVLMSTKTEAPKTAIKEEPKEEKKTPAPKKAPAKKAAPVEEEEDDEEEFLEEEFEEEGEEEEADEVEKPAPKKAPAKKKAAKKEPAKKAPAKKAKSKNTPYDRNSELHKKLVGEMLTDLLPNWKKNAKLKEACKKASVDMEGEDFLDTNGDVLESFKEEFVSLAEG